MRPARPSLCPGDPLPDRGGGLPDLRAITRPDGRFTVAGYGSLLSPTSSKATFPELTGFRRGVLPGYRRVFAHTTAVFHERGVARPQTREIASLSVEPCADTRLAVALFDVPATADGAAALLEREHEFQFVAVAVEDEEQGEPTLALACASWNDDDYRAQRVADTAAWAARYHGTYPDGTPYAIQAVWSDPNVLPCRPYLRHVVLAARALGVEACVLDNTVLADRRTTVRQHLARDSSIMEEGPPKGLEARYGG